MSKRSRSHSPIDSQVLDTSPSRSPAPSSHNDGTKKHTLDTTALAVEVMHCSLPPHKGSISFSSFEDYEVHYLQAHVNRCSECGRNFPTERFLNLHIEENHDSFISARRARGEKTYGCFVEGCDRKCLTPQKRRMHLIDKHMFPRTYNFYIVNDGIDKQSSMLRSRHDHKTRLSICSSTSNSAQEGRLRRRLSTQSDEASNGVLFSRNEEKEHQLPLSGVEIDELEKSMSALQFVPTAVLKNRKR